MKALWFLILISCCFLIACNKDSNATPQSPLKPLRIVISDITSTLTIYNFSITNQSDVKLIDIYAQTQNKTYTVNVKSGDTLTINYFLELEGPSPAVAPVITFIYNGVPMLTVTNRSGIVSGQKDITVP
jgi:hypothetical protein